MEKKGGRLEILGLRFLKQILDELGYTVIGDHIQQSGTQDGYDCLVQFVDERFKLHRIYCECKDYNTDLNYSDAATKIPQISKVINSKSDLVLFLSPKKNFNNVKEETKNKEFFEKLGEHFRVSFLTPATYIDKYFALYPEIYSEIYNEPAPLLDPEKREELLQSFEKFIFSDQLLRKIVINESDRQKYIREIDSLQYPISRTVRRSQERLRYGMLDHPHQRLTDAAKKSTFGIVLLGGAGYGKSTELKKCALELWETRVENITIPTFPNLKTFNTNSSIAGILPSDCLELANQIIFFDGVDELENMIDFSNKLKEYIDQNKTQIKQNQIKFVISCRSNIYRKYLKQLTEFELYYLNEVSFGAAQDFLGKKYDLDLLTHPKFDYWQERQLFENPFYLELVGSYFQKHKTLKTDKATLIREFVNSRLERDGNDKFANDIHFDREAVIEHTKKIAFSLEAMQRSDLSPQEIRKITGLDDKFLSKNPFLEQNADDKWGFENKNIQEYFIASTLTELIFDEILEFVRISNEIPRIHPTWYNVVSFMLNLEKRNEVYNQLVDWLIENDYEVLFTADTNRISDDIRVKLLQKHFEKTCEEETLWITDVNQVANIVESQESIQYLIGKLKNTGLHKRGRISAMKLLGCMNLDEPSSDIIQETILSSLLSTKSEDELDITFKQSLIHLAKDVRSANDKSSYNKILSILKEDDNREIVSALISTVPTVDIVGNLDYFLDILSKALGYKHWKVTAKTNSITSTKRKIFDLFYRVHEPDALLRILTFVSSCHDRYVLKDRLYEELIDHVINIFTSHQLYNPALAEMISQTLITSGQRYYEVNPLIKLVTETGISKQVFESVWESVDNESHNGEFIAALITEEQFPLVGKTYNNGKIADEILVRLRNRMSHRDFKKSKTFEQKIENSTTFTFTDKITLEEYKYSANTYHRENQANFDVLFDQMEIISEINVLYEYFDAEILTKENMTEIYQKFHTDPNIHTKVKRNTKILLAEIIRDNPSGEFPLSEIPGAIHRKLDDILHDIFYSLPTEKRNSDIVISPAQNAFIKGWCDSKINLFKDKYGNLTLGGEQQWDAIDYESFSLIYSFHKKLDFDYSIDILLDMLWFDFQDDKVNIDELKERVRIAEIDTRIQWNLTHLNLTPPIFYNHFTYCIDNGISVSSVDLLPIIESYLENGNEHYANKLIEKIYASDHETLSYLLKYEGKVYVKRQLFYTLLKIIKDAKDLFPLGIDFIKKNEDSLIDEQVFGEFDIIRYYVAFNDEAAFRKLHTYIVDKIEKKLVSSLEFRQDEWQRYTNPDAIEDLIAIFSLYLYTPDCHEYFDRFSLPVRIASEAITNICRNGNADITLRVLDMLEEQDFRKIKAAGGDLFYYHRLKNDLLEIFYNHKSIPFDMKKTLEVIRQNSFAF